MGQRTWDRKSVIDAIRVWHQQGRPLTQVWRDQPSLAYAAYHWFGSWPKAIAAAGIKVKRQKKWSRERVLREIRARHRRGQRLESMARIDPPLHGAASRRFGSWPDAVRAAGLEPIVRHKWSPERVVQVLQARHSQGQSLWSRHQPAEGALRYAAVRYFGSWTKALVAAGLRNPNQLQWTPQRVVEELQARNRAGARLTFSHLDGALKAAIRAHFGNWSAVRVAAGLPTTSPAPVPRRWSAAKVVRELQTRLAQGLSLKADDNKRLWKAARRYFGSWHEALEAVGVKRERPRRWTKQMVLDEITAGQRQGLFEDTTRPCCRGLGSAARTFFGSWWQALIVAGVIAPGARRKNQGPKWTRQRVLAAIQDRYVRGLPLTTESDRSLATAAARYFGNWYEARVAAGIPVGKPPRPRRRWSEGKILAAIRDRERRGLPLKGIHGRDYGLASAATRYFGSWNLALIAAGKDVVPRKTLTWSKAKVLELIRDRHQKGRSLNCRHPANRLLFRAAYRYFGSWPNALQAAGLDSDVSSLRYQTRKQGTGDGPDGIVLRSTHDL
jgi:hypothetical protein